MDHSNIGHKRPLKNEKMVNKYNWSLDKGKSDRETKVSRKEKEIKSHVN